MGDREEQQVWSIVMTRFNRAGIPPSDVLEDAFPNSGIDAFALVTKQEEHMPCEMAAGLTREAAELAVEKLSAGGFEVAAMPAREVGEVKLCASDLWPDRSWGKVHFCEVDGLITTCSRLNSLYWIRKFRTDDPNARDWDIEHFLNHHHFDWDLDMSPDAIEEVMNWVDQLIDALVHTYPSTKFTVSIGLGDVISFWQTSDDSPREDHVPEEEETTGLTWCVKCQEHLPYGPSQFVDKRFEEAKWGTCSKCGALLLIQSVERLIFVNDPRVPSLT